MPLMLAAILDSTEVLVGVGLIAAWLVLMSLKIISSELTNSIRMHNLKVEAHRLRLRQRRRLVELGVEKRTSQ
jgi:hypothetical protein